MADVLSPTPAGNLKPYNLLPGVIGETVLAVWFLVKGVEAERWRPQAGAMV